MNPLLLFTLVSQMTERVARAHIRYDTANRNGYALFLVHERPNH